MDVEKSRYSDERADFNSSSVDEEQEGLVTGVPRPRPAARTRLQVLARWSPLLLLLSLLCNLLQGVYIVVRKPICLSLYAKLPENELNIPYQYSTEYGSANHDHEARNALWAAIDVSDGFVALTHEESDALGLPRSEIFPWDSNKGMYLNHGYHALHCVTLLYAHTWDAHQGRKPLVSYHHVEHCLDLLRQDIMCRADDHLDYTGGAGDGFLVGDNQDRKCRDWDKMTDWLKERTACYKSVNVTRSGEDFGVESELERYTHCPPGSPYLPLIEEWRYLNRPNPGNLDVEGVKNMTEAEAKAHAEAVNIHNGQILGTTGTSTSDEDDEESQEEIEEE